jgi:hypothetical protein
MTGRTVRHVDAGPFDDAAPPRGTAIVRPLRHVRAVRECYLRRFADPSQAAVSRSARAWAWALGERVSAPVTDRQTAIPPSRSEIETEIEVADQRRLRGDQESRADAAATVLRWLIGDDDRVPVRGKAPGELVGGFGDVVRPQELIGRILAAAVKSKQRAEAEGRNAGVGEDARHDAAYLDGVVATLVWILGGQAETPVTRVRSRELTTKDLKVERVYAEDVIEQASRPWMTDRLPPASYSEGVKFSINWLLGDSTTPPVDPAGQGPYGRGSKLPATLAPPRSGSADPRPRQ